MLGQKIDFFFFWKKLFGENITINKDVQNRCTNSNKVP